jgi:predicted nucleic acid-binding protein
MATVVSDTSFLFALFGSDAHSAAARAWTRQAGQSITVTALNRYELGNALRFAVFRKVIAAADAWHSLAAYEADLKSGHLHLMRCDLETVVAEAARLSERYTTGGGHRSFDVLHVATARVLKATVFLSFDLNQRKLAAAAGLTVEP